MPRLDLLATGYPSLDHILAASRSPAVGETALLDDIVDDQTVTYGGCGPNVAAGLQRLGFRTGLAMVLGDDAAGRKYREYLTGAGVDCQNVLHLAGHKTSRSYLFCNPDGEYQNFFFPGATDAWTGPLTPSGLDQTGLALITVGYYPYNVQFMEAAVRQAVPLAWQLKPDVAAYPAGQLQRFVRASRLIFFNRIEADYLCQGLGISTLTDLFQFGPQILVLTLGKEGCRVLTSEAQYAIPAVVRPAVDTTGAGDGFTAGFLAGYLKGLDSVTCGRLGTVLASFVIEKTGCQTNLPTWTQLEARYRETYQVSIPMPEQTQP